MILMRSLGLLLAGFLLAEPALAAPSRSTIVAALEEDVRGSDPQRERDGLADAVHLHVVEGLVGFRNDLEVAPMLAERIDTENEGRTYVFTLREGVRFHNGAVMTAADVKWSFDYLMKKGSLWRCLPVLSGGAGGMKVVSVEVRDPRTIAFTLQEPTANFLRTLARPDCAQTPVLHPSSVRSDGSWDHPVGTGPFTIGTRSPGQYVEVHRFADYTPRSDEPSGFVGAKKAEVDTIRFLIVGDPAARVMGLQSGDLDVGLVPPQFVAALRNTHRLNIVTSDTTVWVALVLNDTDPVLTDPRVRRALALAIDRDAVAKGVSFGQSRGTASRVPRSSRYFVATPQDEAHGDPEAARRLLQEAGYAGQPVRITTNKRFSIMYDCAVLVQAMLAKAGVNASLDVVEWSLQLERTMRRTYTSQLLAFSGRYSAMAAWENILGPEPQKSWKDPRAIELLHVAERSQDEQEIRTALDGLLERFLDQTPAVGLYFATGNMGVNRRLQGYTGSPFEAIRLWNVSIRQGTAHAER